MKKRLTHILLCMLLLTIFFSVSVKAEENIDLTSGGNAAQP